MLERRDVRRGNPDVNNHALEARSLDGSPRRLEVIRFPAQPDEARGKKGVRRAWRRWRGAAPQRWADAVAVAVVLAVRARALFSDWCGEGAQSACSVLVQSQTPTQQIRGDSFWYCFVKLSMFM